MMAVNNKLILVLCSFLFLVGCTAGRLTFDPGKKLSREQLQHDFQVMRNILEEGHPSLYWYSSRDSLDEVFDRAYANISDSMTEPQFRTLLSYVISKVNCGHTSLRYSKKYYRYLDTVRLKQFPLSLKLWGDSAIVYANLHRTDSILKRGTIINSINNKPLVFYRDSLFQYLTMDGYGINHKYQTLSNRGNFGGWYRNVFGLRAQFTIGYLNRMGEEKSMVIPVFDPATDSLANVNSLRSPQGGARERRRMAIASSRDLKIDTSSSTAWVALNTFSRGNGLSSFLRKTFKTLHRQQIQNFVLDLRSNGGGNVGMSTLLTRYLINHRFKLADSLYAVNKKSNYGKYIQHYLWNQLFMNIITKKRSDGKYHFGYFTRHFFNPKKKNHFNGNTYLIIGGNSFSATTLFANALKGQENVLLVGEETGGGAYGNSAWLIPDVTLPNSRLRMRLPKFRMVISKAAVKDGRGVQPDVFVGPSLESIRNGIDPKMEKVRELIKTKNNTVRH
ncbi:MAG: S41 family peptidase [Chitinophagaceae bacterium]